MLKIITDQKAIKKYAGQFHRKFKPFVAEIIKVRLGHQGASFPARVQWLKQLGLWKFSQTVRETRYWNAFGLDRPGPSGVLSIASEMNFPWARIDRKVGGAFARDHWGNVFVIHRGKIGGGKKGIGKSLFEHNYRGVWTMMEDGDSLSQVAVIGHLQSERFAQQAAQFVKKIEFMKLSATRSIQTEMDFAEIRFREDLIGSEALLPEEEIVTACDRDLLTNHLASQLQLQKIKIGNNTETELFAVEPAGNRISHIFELITDLRERNVLAAVGKLIFQTTVGALNPLPVLVLPEERREHFTRKLRRINISTMGFHWKQDQAFFRDWKNQDCLFVGEIFCYPTPLSEEYI